MDRSGLVVRDPVHGELRVGLLGRHQAANVAVALGVLEAMAGRGLCSIDGATLRRGLEAARWPGRMELLALAAEDRAIRPRLDRPDPRAPDLLLDGAHNAAGARALAEAFDDLQARLSPGRPTLLVGVLRDKELVPMLDALRASTGLSEARLIATRVPGTARALAAAEIAAAWSARAAPGASAGEPAAALESVNDALAAAVATARSEGGPLIVAGSLYLVGHVRGKLFDDPLLRDPEA